MRWPRLLPLLVALVILPISLRAERDPDLHAYITRVASPSDFDVDGLHVLLDPSTILESGKDKQVSPLGTLSPFVGEVANVWGHADRSAVTIRATRIVLMQPRPYVVRGSAIIDLIPASPAGTHRLRADGRILEISNNVLDHPVPLAPGAPSTAGATDLRTNVWVDYHGLRRPDGIVIVDWASFADNSVDDSERKLRAKREYDPAAVEENSHQSVASLRIKGIDPRQIPPFKDPPMRDRVERIGRSLIPAFQRALPIDDPTRIDFRFQLVDQPKWTDAYTLASGIILVPRQVVSRLVNDSQLAAVLAGNIAIAFEKQTYRSRGTVHVLKATGIVLAAAADLPGNVLTATLPGPVFGDHILIPAQEQADRVSLALMADAGYDLDQAPEAWWILATKEGRNPHAASPPDRAAVLFDELGTTWQPANRPPAHP